MAFEKLKLDISLLLTQMQNEPEDRHEIYLVLREKLHEIEAFGMPLPQDLVNLASQLEREFASELPNT